MLGLMFYEPSPRYIDPHQARALLDSIGAVPAGGGRANAEYDESVGADLSCPSPIYRPTGNPPHARTNLLNSIITPDLVGVFVNKDTTYINEVAEQVGLHIVQLHGNESPEFCRTITRPVIKALRPQDMTDVDKLRAYREVAWHILLDTPTPKWGGSGMKHDWSLARTAAKEASILLAGGLTPENVVEAIQQVYPWGVDVSSGVETNGKKDVEKIRAFIENVRNAVAASPS